MIFEGLMKIFKETYCWVKKKYLYIPPLNSKQKHEHRKPF